jgi:hypothetical protein
MLPGSEEFSGIMAAETSVNGKVYLFGKARAKERVFIDKLSRRLAR